MTETTLSPSLSRGRISVPPRRSQVTQKVLIGNSRRLYISVHDDPHPQEIYLRVHGPNVSDEITALYDTIARLASLALQCGATVEEVGTMMYQSKFLPAGPITGDERIKTCASVVDYVGRHLLVYFDGREDLAHVPVSRGVSIESRTGETSDRAEVESV